MASYVQYGCGWSAPPEWINFDASPTLRWEKFPLVGRLYTKNASRFPANVEYGDIVRGLPVDDASVAGVYCSHVLEHLPRDTINIALSNTLRILKPEGIFRLVVPDLRWRVEQYLQNLDSGEENPSDWLIDNLNMGRRGTLSLAKAATALLGHSEHLWMYDKQTMTSILKRAGFSDIRECEYNDSKDPMFNLVEDRARFYSGVHKEVCIEAKRPTN